jgi:hypothetical protein
MEKESKIHSSLQMEKYINANEGKEKMKENLKFLHLKKQGYMIVKMHYVDHFIV